MSSAKAAVSSGSVIAWPPYFTTTSAPWNRSSQGRASTRTSAFCFAVLVMARSRAVRRVLVHVRVGEVVRPDRRGGFAGVQVDDHVDVPRRQVDQVARLPRLT